MCFRDIVFYMVCYTRHGIVHTGGKMPVNQSKKTRAGLSKSRRERRKKSKDERAVGVRRIKDALTQMRQSSPPSRRQKREPVKNFT
jgi:hypothetical protein